MTVSGPCHTTTHSARSSLAFALVIASVDTLRQSPLPPLSSAGHWFSPTLVASRREDVQATWQSPLWADWYTPTGERNHETLPSQWKHPLPWISTNWT